MLKISVDEAYAFDFLSILELKNDLKNQSDLKILEHYQFCFNELIIQIGDQYFYQIIDSSEYKKLLNTNRVLFDAISASIKNRVSAQYVEQCNQKRYQAKQKLQKKFFYKELVEQKFYENNFK